jgi:hypothetical protein
MTSTLTRYGTLSDALKDYTDTSNPEQAATKLLNTIKKKFPHATHVVLCANTDLKSPSYGRYIVYPIGPGLPNEKIEDFEGGIYIEIGPMDRFPVAYVELKR